MYPSNRNTARKAQRRGSWCDTCDANVVIRGSKCGVCGKLQKQKRNRKPDTYGN